ncbi:glycosyltransferase family 4 protein [Paenibacillus larvae]|uniref:Putative undecaprenyl-phosphate N-acetylglucosaminyl 1-phosphate transferase TagO n=1 Tax=Paenibacillus larvae subsp. larvae DSM 25430 TaxID=697284 RepID=V9W1I7_9BACL|nr:MraY family glycosyltransferase [Paenibacillus larvae]AHD03963.1 putative undecaprenyl-phosphate N-acetylglucosaminyl 1-phosphate transferase TagO [Paenibacillus larvae subsp. larvae DSM 25430]AVG10569.1 putative undecaprenyl-phosphate N-acetylglucosaminyl 1-phosphate transferase TagO [Paenibacillus larvae subsp. larvae DSM 25430]MDR5567639.1 MraY family glycosyltransferase [Paenibacillus larvae]MDR5594356.1 MraY family glycosyltransferase [Paenibacillus larvae]
MYAFYVIGFIVACLFALLLTPLVKKFAFWVGAVDAPNHRKVHTRIMPRLGGFAIFIAFVGAYCVISPVIGAFHTEATIPMLLGGFVIVLTGALDDRFELSPKMKLLGQLIAAIMVVVSGLQIDVVKIPFTGSEWVIPNVISIPLTIIWIIGVSNAINLIDGLDGLSAGVSGIATATMMVLAIMMPEPTVVLFSVILLGSIVGFLFYNFHPAKIFMGDSGALFLGYALATLSIMGFKQAAVLSLLTPILILGVPLSDTFFAIVRRYVNKKPISVADKNHLHHCLLQLGFSHRTTVLIIYGIALFFGGCAILFNQVGQWWAVAGVVVLSVILIVGAEAIGIISKSRKPVLGLLQKMRMKDSLNSRLPK